MDALKSGKRAKGSALDARVSDIELDHFVASDGTGVGNSYGSVDRGIGVRLAGSDRGVRVGKRRIAEPIPELIQRLFGKISVSAAKHGVIREWRQLRDGLIESNR